MGNSKAKSDNGGLIALLCVLGGGDRRAGSRSYNNGSRKEDGGDAGSF